MGGEELFKQLGIDVFAIRNQVRLETINALSKKELLQLSPQDIERMGGVELFMQLSRWVIQNRRTYCFTKPPKVA